MSIIILKENSTNRSDETLKGAPLESSQVDSNFQNLNSSKLETDGSMPINGDLTIDGDLISTDNSLTITTNAGGNVNVTIDGNLTVDGTQTISGGTITADLKQILADGTTTAAEANTAGLEIRGDSLWASILFDAPNSRWVSDIDFSASNFIISNGKSLIEISDDLDSVRGFIGASDNFDPNYSSTNYVNNGDSLETSIGNLDAELNNLSQIKTFTGADDGFSTSFTDENTVDNGDSLETGIDKLDQLTKYIVSKVKVEDGNFNANPSTLYLVTPNENEEVICTLPSNNKKGRLSVRLENDSLGRKVTVNGFLDDRIESLAVGEGITIDQQKFTVDFLWDETNEVWRVL